MKGHLWFDLDNPDDLSQFKLANSAIDWKLAVFDVAAELKKRLDYDPCSLSEFSDWFWEMLNDRGIDPYKE